MGHFQPTSASAGWSGFWLFSAWPSSPWASLKLKQRQLPIQRLILIFFMEATTVLDIIMEAIMATLTTESTARGLLKLKLPLLLRPRLKLTLGTGTMVDMVLDTTVDTTVDTTEAIMATLTTESMARGLLKLKLPLLLWPRLKLIPGMDTMVDMVLDTMVDTMVDTTVDTTATHTTVDMVLDTMVDTTVDTMATPTEATTESMASKKGTSNSGLMSMKCHRF